MLCPLHAKVKEHKSTMLLLLLLLLLLSATENKGEIKTIF